MYLQNLFLSLWLWNWIFPAKFLSVSWVMYNRDKEGDYLTPLFVLYCGAVIGRYIFYWCFLGDVRIILGAFEKILLLSLISLGVILPYFIKSLSLSLRRYVSRILFLPFITGIAALSVSNTRSTLIFVHSQAIRGLFGGKKIYSYIWINNWEKPPPKVNLNLFLFFNHLCYTIVRLVNKFNKLYCLLCLGVVQFKSNSTEL